MRSKTLRLKRRKNISFCNYCCRASVNGSVIHIKCIEEFLKKHNLFILANPLTDKRVLPW